MAQLLVSITILLAGTSSPAAQVPDSLGYKAIRALPVQHDSRWMPLDTVARDIVTSVTGDPFFNDRDPVAMLLAWTFDPTTWMRQPLISIANAELRGELQLPANQTRFSYNELINHGRLRQIMEETHRLPRGQKMDPLQRKVSDISEKLGTLQGVFSHEVIRPVPDPTDVGGRWKPIGLPDPAADAEMQRVQEAWAAVRTGFNEDDPAAFNAAVSNLSNRLAALPAAYRPTPARIATELHYNSLNPYRTAWMVMLAGFVLAAVAMVVRRWWFDAITLLAMVAGFALLSYGLWLRWTIAGRIPAANMFESLLFLSWGMGAFAIVSTFLLKHRLVPLTASGMGAIALMLADLLPMDSFVRPIPPVLQDTIWMSIHVPVIMVSYSVLALGVLIAHMQLVTAAAAPRNHRAVTTLDNLHYWYIHVGSILLLAGIVTGSMWAASSWGRYWGWDPKEVWSLVALLGYLTILHVRIDRDRVPAWAYMLAAAMGIAFLALVVPRLAPLTGGKVLALAGATAGMVLLVATRGPVATAMKSILCFWLIIMTYVGVNYVLGIGLHSYGFGTGAVVRYMFLLGGADLVFIAGCCAVYLFRTRVLDTPSVGSALPQPV